MKTSDRSSLTLAALAALLLVPAASALGDGAKKPTVDFVKHVKPILEKGCVKCHGPREQKGDYRMDTKEAAMKPGEHLAESSRLPIVAGKSAESYIYVFAAAKAPDRAKHIMPMPPKKERTRLTDAEVAVIGKWIDEGATWPEGVTLTSPK